MMSRFTEQQPHKGRVGVLPQDQRGFCETSVGPDKETHGTLVPSKKTGRGWSTTRSTKTTTDKRQQGSIETNVFQENECYITFGIMHGDGVDSRNLKYTE